MMQSQYKYEKCEATIYKTGAGWNIDFLGKGGGSLHLVKMQLETWSCSLGRRLPFLNTYDKVVTELRLSGTLHIESHG